MPYCPSCGHQTSNTDKYCQKCGHSLDFNKSETRRQVFEGVLRKCPNCGNTLNAFDRRCQDCGYDISGSVQSPAIIGFVNTLHYLESIRPPFVNTEVRIVDRTDVNGQTYGAYDMNAMSQMIANGQVKRDTYVWTQGLANWIKAEDIPEICQLFNLASNATPPPPPIT